MSALGSFKAYKLTNRVNGRAYIGITKRTLQKRWSGHLTWARNGRKGVLADAIREHGEAAFAIEHLASARTWHDLCATELTLICQERTTIWDGGYNASQGGEGSAGYRPVVSSERRLAALRAAISGVPKSPAHRAKLALARIGSKASQETKAKMSLARKGKKRLPEHVKKWAAALAGQPKTPEHRAKLSTAATGRKVSAETRARLSAIRQGKKLNLTPEQRAHRSRYTSAARRAQEAAKVLRP